MKKFLIGIVTLVAAVMLSSPAFGALTTYTYDMGPTGLVYNDLGTGDYSFGFWDATVKELTPVALNPLYIEGNSGDPNVITSLNDAWGSNGVALDLNTTYFYKNDSPTGGIQEFDPAVEIVLFKWGAGFNPYSQYAFLLDGFTPKVEWSVPKDSMSHVSGISAVPVPAAAWLLGSGVLGLVAIRRRRS